MWIQLGHLLPRAATARPMPAKGRPRQFASEPSESGSAVLQGCLRTPTRPEGLQLRFTRRV